MSISAAKLQANRANALKSTGPRTVKGKRRSRANAVTHGLFCKDVAVAGESDSLFKFLRDNLIHDLQPQNVMELSIVDRVVIDQWKLRRYQLAEKMFYERQMMALQEKAEAQIEDGDDEKSLGEVIQMCQTREDSPLLSGFAIVNSIINDDKFLEKISLLEQRLENSIHRNLRELERLRKLREKQKDLPRSPFDELGLSSARVCAVVGEVMEKADDDGEDEGVEDTGETPVTPDNTSNVKNEPTEKAAEAMVGKGVKVGGTGFQPVASQLNHGLETRATLHQGLETSATLHHGLGTRATSIANMKNEPTAGVDRPGVVNERVT